MRGKRRGVVEELGSSRLPGAGTLQLREARDAFGRPFAMPVVRVPRRTVSVVLTAMVPAAASTDPVTVDLWLAELNRWFAALADNEWDLQAGTITIEAGPNALDPGRRTAATGFADLPVHVALTFTAGASRARRAQPDTAVTLGARLPGLCAGAPMPRGVVVEPVGGEELTAAVRTAYDPSVADFIGQGKAAGRLAWSQAGPTQSRELWDHLRHDGACSVTWSMASASLSEGALAEALVHAVAGPDAPTIAHRRVTLLYRRQDEPQSDEPPVGFECRGLLLTGTARAAEPSAALTAADGIPAVYRHLLRRAYGRQAPGFAATLPLGLIAPDHLRLPRTGQGLEKNSGRGRQRQRSHRTPPRDAP